MTATEGIAIAGIVLSAFLGYLSYRIAKEGRDEAKSLDLLDPLHTMGAAARTRGMADKSGIEWTDATWNPVTGCSKVSPGCAHCYAERLSLRFGWSHKPWTPEHEAENVILHPERLTIPLRWKRPRMVIVNSMSDLFHER